MDYIYQDAQIALKHDIMWLGLHTEDGKNMEGPHLTPTSLGTLAHSQEAGMVILS